ncbi:hypothetical protein GJ496_001131 [Pomphorhynchus laevis]|nr:hypothetical protein GJ496_001131 [Pomphorhynchus laevis]
MHPLSQRAMINVLGCVVEKTTIRPDPDRTKALLALSEPHSKQQVNRTMGMLAHYSNLIKDFSKRLRPIIECKKLSCNADTMTAFKSMQNDVASFVLS